MKALLPLLAPLVLGTALLLTLSAQDIKAPPLTKAAPEKKQGLTATFTADGKNDTRSTRLVALFVPAGQAPTSFLPAGPFTAKWEAEIVSELRAEYTFTVETTGVVTATLNDVPLLDSRLRIAPRPVQLQKGGNKLVVEFQSPAQGDAVVRLLWSSKEFPRALMPKIFAGEDGKVAQQAADLAAYFASASVPIAAKPLEMGRADQGGALFANLGCVACHTKPDADGQDAHNRGPLAHVKAKWNPAALLEFLQDPQKNYAWIRMPHFRLNAEESSKLAAYLLSTASQEFPAGPKGDATRGAQLLATSNCLNCHAGVPPPTTPALTAMLAGGWSKGCLAPDTAARGKAPDFHFTPEQRNALVSFAAQGFTSLKQDAPVEFADRQIKNLNCTACHSADGQPSTWSQLEEEVLALQNGAPLGEGEGQPIHTTALPMLTWFGEKLRPDYLATFIAGHAKDKPRTWIVSRMPGFATYAEPLAKGLAHAHDLSTTIPAEAAPDAEKVKTGETLIGESGGFNCLQCHTLADRAATAVFEAPGPNLALTPVRLRKEYFHHWVLAPTRIDAETKMPKFADETGKTPLTDFYNGQASEQFDAIWQYLQTLEK